VLSGYFCSILSSVRNMLHYNKKISANYSLQATKYFKFLFCSTVKFTRVTRIYIIHKVLNLVHLSCTDVSKILRIFEAFAIIYRNT